MRTIDRTTRFKRDYKREAKGLHRATLEGDIRTVVALLATDQPLPVKYRDHPLTGEWKDFRDCHVRPDLVLIYQKADPNVLRLVRLGSHGELGF